VGTGVDASDLAEWTEVLAGRLVGCIPPRDVVHLPTESDEVPTQVEDEEVAAADPFLAGWIEGVVGQADH